MLLFYYIKIFRKTLGFVLFYYGGQVLPTSSPPLSETETADKHCYPAVPTIGGLR